jgi:acid-sensing ion channel, other
MFFKEDQLITYKRSELFGQTDFLANCGGLLGLFMGVSFMSILEIIYFCTLRLWCNIRRQRRIEKSEDQPIIWVSSMSRNPVQIKQNPE